VSQANGPADGVVEQNGQAVGEAEHEGYAGSVGDQSIGGRDHLTTIIRPDQRHPAPVHLMGGGDIASRDAQGVVDEIMVSLHQLMIVTDQVTHVERLAGRRAYPT